jgi:predicted nucleic acid-binding Zn ribbon protein
LSQSRDGGQAPRASGTGRAGRGRPKRLDLSDHPQSLATVLGELGRTRPLASGIALGQLGRRWSDVVGDRLAAETAPVRLEGGTLVVAASSSAWAVQVRFLAQEISARANGVLPGGPVARIRVVVRSGGVE